MTTYQWLTVFVAANIADALLTLYALRLGGYEANPVIRAAMRVMPPAAALIAIKAAYIALVVVFLDDVAQWLPWLAGVFVAVCLWNLGQILRMRKQ